MEVEKKDLEYIHKKAKEEFQELAGSKILFAGANGFLGFYFIEAILLWNKLYPKKTIKVFALDIFTKGIPKWLKDRDDVEIINEDVTKYIPSLNFDYIIHAASPASPTFYRKYPVETINANVQGLYNILNYMLAKQKTENKIKGLLFFSSSEVYGDPTEDNIPTPETYRGNVSFTGPRSCYDESKRFCETLCINYSKTYNLPIKIARPFNNYGPGLKLNDGRVIPDFANDILLNKDIILFSQGSPTRTFCYITDAIIGYLKILIKGGSAEAYNIGYDKEEISIIDLAKKIKKIAEKYFNYSGKIIKKRSKDKDYLTDNPNRRCPNIAKARKELRFEPEVSLDEGLTNILIWYRESL